MIKLFDGAMGTMLHQAGLPAGSCPELWNVEQPAVITDIHRSYVDCGADIIETNTFGANRLKLAHYGLENKVAAINAAAVRAARLACGPETKIAGSIGPTGRLIYPLGDLHFDEAYDAFYEQITALQQAGVDYIIIETIIDIQEMRAALLAAKAASDKPVICQLTYEADGRTVTGTDPRTAAVILEALGASAIGANCSLGPAQLLPIVERLSAATQLPISVQPNAGMPQLRNGVTVFPMNAAEFAAWTPRLLAAGATYIGGCCGTSPHHIKAMKAAISDYQQTAGPAISRPPRDFTCLASRSKTVSVGQNLPTAIIGERINPTGRKALAGDIRDRQYILLKKEALAQVKAGAHILDVNVGVPGIDQAQAMTEAVQEIAMIVDAPLAIDTTDPATLEAGLRAFPGKALINSVSAEPERLATFLPLAKKYGAAILCLPIASGGVPVTAEERITVIKTIVEAALAAGIPENDLLLDPLVLTVAADSSAALETLRTLRLYRRQFGYPTVMGLSNVSYGLPRRDLINSTFCAMAISSGLDAPILNPYDQTMQDTLAAAAVLRGSDPAAKAYTSRHAAAPSPEQPAAGTAADIVSQIKQTVIDGEKQAVAALIKQALAENHSAVEITEKALTAAMNKVGEAYSEGRCYLPQVMLAAETMRLAFETIKETLPAHTAACLGTVILATVKGDIHDLGKNIVAALLENSGFKVIDLGKDVPAETVIAACTNHQADIVGLCSLMTTTMPQIEHTINQLKAAKITARTIIGGAVVTADYARQVGADSYAANGVEAVRIAKDLLRNLACAKP